MVWTKMSRLTATTPQERPHASYRNEFLQGTAVGGQSVLDVGCGDGATLGLLAEAGWHCIGIEPDEEAAAAARLRGLNVHVARAERLPFEDDSFDAVIFEYMTHHIEHMHAGLFEAMRIVRHHVHILDGWHDPAFPCQRVARRIDEWRKRVDRRSGMVHNLCPDARNLAAPFVMSGLFAIDLTHRLILRLRRIEPLRIELESCLSTTGNDPELRRELRKLLDDAVLHGASDDGAVVLSATRI